MKYSKIPHILVLLLSLLFLLSGCRYRGTQRVVNHCENNKCPVCHSDDDCRILSQPCYKTAQCVHRSVQLQFTAIGCHKEYRVPGKENCLCIKGMCRNPQ
ncbi:hypothetical protein KKF84_09110 [Myxococcota bacterium]|nr:hypothetical protein [Myxococcota bacterium]MBU1535468.1 hypothetical protein [Myxococcota bacterium]